MSLDELEALRLAHLEGLYQEEAAARMGVSRATLGNILASAHRKAADMLVHGKMIVIEGGTVAMNERAFICSACGHGWSVPHGKARPSQCPACGSAELHRKAPAQGKGRCRGNAPCPRRNA
jgi:rubrerythrin